MRIEPFEVYGGHFPDRLDITNPDGWEWVVSCWCHRPQELPIERYVYERFPKEAILNDNIVQCKLRACTHVAIIYPKMDYISGISVKANIYTPDRVENNPIYDIEHLDSIYELSNLGGNSWITTTFSKGDVVKWMKRESVLQ